MEKVLKSAGQNLSGTISPEEELNRIILTHLNQDRLLEKMEPYLEKRERTIQFEPPDSSQLPRWQQEMNILWDDCFRGYQDEIYPLLELLHGENPEYTLNYREILESAKTIPSVYNRVNGEQMLYAFLQDLPAQFRRVQRNSAIDLIMEEFETALPQITGTEWEIKTYPFGPILLGSVLLGDNPGGWNQAGILICDRRIVNIQILLIETGISAPFQVAGYSERLQILTWTEEEAIRDVLDYIKETDQ